MDAFWGCEEALNSFESPFYGGVFWRAEELPFGQFATYDDAELQQIIDGLQIGQEHGHNAGTCETKIEHAHGHEDMKRQEQHWVVAKQVKTENEHKPSTGKVNHEIHHGFDTPELKTERKEEPKQSTEQMSTKMYSRNATGCYQLRILESQYAHSSDYTQQEYKHIHDTDELLQKRSFSSEGLDKKEQHENCSVSVLATKDDPEVMDDVAQKPRIMDFYSMKKQVAGHNCVSTEQFKATQSADDQTHLSEASASSNESNSGKLEWATNLWTSKKQSQVLACQRPRTVAFVTKRNQEVVQKHLEDKKRLSALCPVFKNLEKSKSQNRAGLHALHAVHSQYSELFANLQITKDIIALNMNLFTNAALISLKRQEAVTAEILSGIKTLREKSLLLAKINTKNRAALKKFRKEKLEPHRNIIIQTEDGIRKFGCDECDMLYKRICDLRGHYLRVHNKL